MASAASIRGVLVVACILAVLGEEKADCESKPGGCRCYYDALADGCPQSLGHDGQLAMCSCDYGDNTWLSVLSSFIWAFRQDEMGRSSLAGRFNIQFEADGLISMDVGYTSRVQCGAPMAGVYPGTMFAVDVEELGKFARNLFWPQVRQKLSEVCVPGRIALQLLCLHVELGRRDGHAAQAYAWQLAQLYPLVAGCVQGSTPFPMPGLGDFVKTWSDPKLPEYGTLLGAEDVRRLSWFPDPGLMRGKMPDESDSHYFPCAPLKDPACFPAGSDNLHTSCEHCCDPAKGPHGEAACFMGDWTFNRCCQTPNNQGKFW